MADVRSAESADGTRIHFEVRGDGAPVVLVHGLACDRRMWDGVASLLEAAGRQVITVDLRGHGDSTRIEGEPSIEAFAEDMHAVLHAASATNPTLVGHSAGGIQSIAFASSATDEYRPSSVITFGTSLTVDRLQERLVLRFSATRLFYALLAAPIVGRLVVRTGAFGRRPSPDAITSTIRSARACPRHLKRGWVKAISGRSFVDEVERLLPTVRLGSGDKDTAFSARRLRSSLRSPNNVFEVPGADHMAPLEQPKAVATLILGSKAMH